MSGTDQVVFREYCLGAISANKAAADQLSKFASESRDDEEVQALLVSASRSDNLVRLHERLTDLAGVSEQSSYNVSGKVSAEALVPSISVSTHRPEERLLHHLIASYGLEACSCAYAEIVGALALAASDETTEAVAKKMRDQKRLAMEAIFHFLPSRSKIGFNMLTVDEVDPAIETKVADDRLIDGK